MLLALFLISSCVAFADPVEYRIAKSNDNIVKLEVDKTGLFKGKKHQFEFPEVSGKLLFDAQNPANSKVEMTIGAVNIVVKDDWVNDKDKKKILNEAQNSMLKTRQYPEMRFASSRITAQGGNRYRVEGTLNIRGVGKPVAIDATLDADKMIITGKSVFKMTAFGMKPPSSALGAIGTKDDMTATFKIAATR